MYIYIYIHSQPEGVRVVVSFSNGWCSVASISYVLTICNRNLSMVAMWTYDNLSFFTITQTLRFGNERASNGFARCWALASAIYIYLGIYSVRRARC